MSAYIEQFADHVDENGRRLVVRNGYQHELDTLTSGGYGRREGAEGARASRPGYPEWQRFSSSTLPALGARDSADERDAADAVSARNSPSATSVRHSSSSSDRVPGGRRTRSAR